MVLDDTAVSDLTVKFVLPASPDFVVINTTPFAPRAPYTADAVASFNTLKEAISSACKRAISFCVDSIPSIKINGSCLPVPKVPKPRMKN
ncbi:hypothetical protein D3C87_1302490 [compost metagenome]